MPIYEYECKKCGEVFSIFKSTAIYEKDTKCPKCASGNVKKLVSAFSCCPSGGSSFGSTGFNPYRSFGGG